MFSGSVTGWQWVTIPDTYMSRRGQMLLVGISSILIHSFVLSQIQSIPFVKYWHAAELFLQNKLIGERILDFSPLYLYFHVLLVKLKVPQAFLLWIQIFCVAASAALLYQLLCRYVRTTIAVAGIGAFILDRSLMVYTHTSEPEPVVLLWIVAATYLISLQTARAALWGGLCFGMGILTRPNFVPVLLAVPFFYKVNSIDTSWRKKTLLFFVSSLCCLVGLWIRNAAVVGYFSPFVMNPGTALYEGNNPNSWGMSSVYPPVLNQLSDQYARQPDYHHQLYRDFARRITGRDLTLPEVNSYWTSKSIHFLIDHPSRTISLLATKILHFFHAFQWHDLANAYLAEIEIKRTWVLATPFAFVSALALLGMIVLSAQWKRYLIFYAVFFSQFFFMLSIYVSARQRISILFLFILFACGMLESIIAKKKLWLVIPAALLFLPLSLPTDLMREEKHLWDNIRQSNRRLVDAYSLRNQGKLLDAARSSSLALAIAPWFLDSRRPANLPFGENGYEQTALTFSRQDDPALLMDKAVLLIEANKIGDARKILNELYRAGYRLKRDDYQSSELRFYIARCEIKNNQRRQAITTLLEAIQNSPGDPSSLAYLAALTGQNKYKQQLLRYFDDIDAAFFLGKAYLETSNPAAAVQQFRYVTAMLPEFRKGFIYLAAALSESGEYSEAAKHYRRAMSVRADPVFMEKEILKLFGELARQEQSAISYYSYGFVLRQFGHFREALEMQQKAITLGQANQSIQEEIRNLQKVIATIENKAANTAR
ncbi:hypothetical protein L0222_01870 [bacterium]|nr:hypothetical protein [bacterium]MCI0604724.1 hypothetical protein [bacterium]